MVKNIIPLIGMKPLIGMPNPIVRKPMPIIKKSIPIKRLTPTLPGGPQHRERIGMPNPIVQRYVKEEENPYIKELRELNEEKEKLQRKQTELKVHVNNLMDELSKIKKEIMQKKIAPIHVHLPEKTKTPTLPIQRNKNITAGDFEPAKPLVQHRIKSVKQKHESKIPSMPKSTSTSASIAMDTAGTSGSVGGRADIPTGYPKNNSTIWIILGISAALAGILLMKGRR